MGGRGRKRKRKRKKEGKRISMGSRVKENNAIEEDMPASPLIKLDGLQGHRHHLHCPIFLPLYLLCSCLFSSLSSTFILFFFFSLFFLFFIVIIKDTLAFRLRVDLRYRTSLASSFDTFCFIYLIMKEKKKKRYLSHLSVGARTRV